MDYMCVVHVYAWVYAGQVVVSRDAPNPVQKGRPDHRTLRVMSLSSAFMHAWQRPFPAMHTVVAQCQLTIYEFQF